MEDIYTITEDGFVGNSIEVRMRKGHCSIELDHPWHGSTEEGFGATLTGSLTPAQARTMGEKLIAWADAESATKKSKR